MVDYSENSKQNIGDLVLQIHDIENRLAVLRRKGEALVAPLRAIADFFDSNRQEEIELVLVEEGFLPLHTHLEDKESKFHLKAGTIQLFRILTT